MSLQVVHQNDDTDICALLGVSEDVPLQKRSKTAGPEEKEESESEGRKVGLDPGKRNNGENNKRLRYTTAQRNFESGLTRYREVQLKEKRWRQQRRNSPSCLTGRAISCNTQIT